MLSSSHWENSAALLDRVMETSPVGITLVDAAGQIVFANLRATQILGLTKTEISQRTYDAPTWRITAYDGGPFLEEQLPFAVVQRTRQPVFGVRHAIEWTDGRRVLLAINAAPFFTETGAFDGIIATVEDVTAQIQAEMALRDSEARFRNVFEASPMGMHMYRLEADDRLVFIGANPAADKILGVQNQQFVGKTLEEAFPALTATEVPLRYRQAATGIPWQTSQITYDENGMAGAFEVYAFQTSPGCMVAMFWDITERLRVQHLLQNITDSTPSAMIALNPAGQVLLWNPAMTHLTGQSAAQMIGQNVWTACPALNRYRVLFDRVIAQHTAVFQPREFLETAHGVVYQDIAVYPLIANHIEGVVLRIDDATRRVQMEEMMLQSAKMASIGGLAAGVAHEINNPLGAMMQSAQILQMALDTRRDATRRHLKAFGVDPDALGAYLEARELIGYMEGIRQTGQRAAKIVSDLLSFSRRTSSNMAPHDLNELITRTLDLAATDYDLKKQYDFRNFDIQLLLAPGLPELNCDGQQIQQVLLNLVRNAAQAIAEQFIPPHTDAARTPRLIVRTALLPGSLPWFRLEIEDNGPGIPEEVRQHLFEPFFTTKAIGEGSGLGLWLCWSIIVERHHGQIWSEPGDEGGARFVIELPAHF
ncbi:MAG TPA: PAS domain S-box protein [Anaerolineae bacterium]|nr:PAS domain S-box protein [Anaerolineae bacterium]